MDNNDKTRILITGASGLVGSYIAAALSTVSSYQVTAQARKRQIVSSEYSLSSLALDLESAEAGQIISSMHPSIIIHCAAQIPTPHMSSEDSAHANRAIDDNIYEAAKRSGGRVIFISSIGLYQNNESPWRESDLCIPVDEYSKQKLLTEGKLSLLDAGNVSLRISSPYGGRHGENRNVLYKFLHLAQRNAKLEIFGLGGRKQDFIFGKDIADAVSTIVQRMASDVDVGGIYNIASGKPISMKGLGELIIDVVGKGSMTFSGQFDPQEGFLPIIDVNKARRELGWAPATTLRQGLAQTDEIIRS